MLQGVGNTAAGLVPKLSAGLGICPTPPVYMPSPCNLQAIQSPTVSDTLMHRFPTGVSNCLTSSCPYAVTL